MDAMSPVEARGRIEEIVFAMYDGDMEQERSLQVEHRERITAALEGLV
jgi:hypothetical protein